LLITFISIFLNVLFYVNFFIDDLSDVSTNDEILPKKQFVITFSESEWNKIKPTEVIYNFNDKSRPLQHVKQYNVLQKNSWTPVVAEHFWAHTQLPCCLTFYRNKVQPNGPNYVIILGRCKICESNFKGIIVEKPPEYSRYLLFYVGLIVTLER